MYFDLILFNFDYTDYYPSFILFRINFISPVLRLVVVMTNGNCLNSEKPLKSMSTINAVSNILVRYNPTICSFKQIPIYSLTQYDLMINGYCRIYYIQPYYNTDNYSFPKNILQLISDSMYNKQNAFIGKYYVDDVKQKNPFSACKLTPDLSPLPKRIQKEIKRLSRDAPPGISIQIHPENYRYFLCVMEGPIDTPYEGGIFYIELFLTKSYPMKPPKARFITRIYHENVDKLERICLDVLKDKWTPALTISRVMLSIQLMLQDPNPEDPLDGQVAGYWKRDPKIRNKNAKECTQRHAIIPKNLMY